ncbi:MAG: dephospho-CoA kinase [Cytophagales bacterium]|jgi:dephospho-CoA kinase|nr:dephospho-CoA kinase [Cytophagales bacterium]MCA6369487.1 dephospho-CoA kinase [Cytophagales bacterium]MCA6373215.1 dephospho-CoA kinase [Cytophagales bacterium]MCA6376358.1 dephospho-CoA kinase [Cytophagales bacterium]MCA6383623.1 dephospho-CoA kinase [Cytophagales bacterium]
MRSKPFQIGITGGIGSGKSVICKIFTCLGVPVYDADSRAKSIMTTDGILIEQIKKEFGDLAYLPDGSLDREYLSRVIFENQEKRTLLNQMVHPRVAADTDRWLDQNREASYVVREAALLIESGAYLRIDKVILVTAPEELRIKRVLARDPHRLKEEVIKIIATQLPEEEKKKKADIVVHNDETQLLVPQIWQLHNQLLKLN